MDVDVALLLIRVTVGATVFAHGAQKLLGIFGGHGISGTADMLESLGFRPGARFAWLLGTAELLGGLLLAPMLGGGSITSGDFSLPNLLISLLGAIILLAIVNLVRRGSVR